LRTPPWFSICQLSLRWRFATFADEVDKKPAAFGVDVVAHRIFAKELVLFACSHFLANETGQLPGADESRGEILGGSAMSADKATPPMISRSV
jgi:hypothetical protein